MHSLSVKLELGVLLQRAPLSLGESYLWSGVYGMADVYRASCDVVDVIAVASVRELNS
jgi:hypothetical protein